MVVLPVLSLTRHTFRTAELGFFGLVVYTLAQTAFFWKQFSSRGEADFALDDWRAPRRTEWASERSERVAQADSEA